MLPRGQHLSVPTSDVRRPMSCYRLDPPGEIEDSHQELQVFEDCQK